MNAINKTNIQLLMYYTSQNRDKLMNHISMNEKILKFTKNDNIINDCINKLIIINDILK